MTQYQVIRNPKYDFIGQSYASKYPNLHRYPATMIPQVGIELLKEFGISSGRLLDPYCGSGTSFICGLECGLQSMFGYDINPLAILISKARFTRLDIAELDTEYLTTQKKISDIVKGDGNCHEIKVTRHPQVTNINFWFSEAVINDLSILKCIISEIENKDIQNLFWVSFAETVRVCSFAKNNEFKLVRMKPDEMRHFNPDAFSYFLKKLNDTIFIYRTFYLPRLKNGTMVGIKADAFYQNGEQYDIVPTSPPYGDSRTTVAYGQFSTLANEWMGMETARRVDSYLMGGKTAKENIKNGCIAEPIAQVANIDKKRALEVSAFYRDLESSIANVARSVTPGGKAIYIVGNRTVKNVPLPTDQFIAEKFTEHGHKHLVTYKRIISNKTMPSKNSPSNVPGEKAETMLFEYIVVCEKGL